MVNPVYPYGLGKGHFTLAVNVLPFPHHCPFIYRHYVNYYPDSPLHGQAYRYPFRLDKVFVSEHYHSRDEQLHPIKNNVKFTLQPASSNVPLMNPPLTI